ncbi:MAG: sodium:solute symporter family transporter [Patescibacteria group bacterium]
MLSVVVGIYFAAMIVIGILTYLKTKTIQGFFLGNRAVGPWISAFAYGTTYFSAVLFIGYAGGQGWSFGLPILWVALGNAFLGCLLPWLILGRRTRAMTAELGAMTMPEYLEARYGSKALKIAGALIIFVFLIPYSAAAYTGLAYLFSVVTRIEYIYVLLAMAGFTAFYVALGGYFAVALTEFVQGLIMLAGAVLMVGYVFNAPAVGGFGQLIPRLSQVNPELVKAFPATFWSIFWLVLLTSLGTWGMPQMVQKFYAIKNVKVISRAMVVGTVFCLIIAGAAYLVGSSTPLFGPAIVAQNDGFAAAPDYERAKMDTVAARGLIDQAMKNDAMNSPDPMKYKSTMIVPQILQSTLPRLLLAIIVVLVLAATMSTVSSLVLVSSSAITIDLLQGALTPKLKKETSVLIMRLLCVLFVALSVYLSWRGPSFLVALMSYSWGTIAGAFLGPYVLGLFWKKVSRPAVWAGMAVGIVISLYSYVGGIYGLFGVTKAQAPMYGSIAMLASVLTVFAVSLLLPQASNAAVDRAFAAAAAKKE